MSYKLAIFDMDGTILDTLEDLWSSTNYALTTHGFPERSIDEVRRFVGNGIRKLIERAVTPEATADEIDAVFQTFRNYYQAHCAIKTKPYDGILKLIQKLRDNHILTAVVSNKADPAVQALCVDYFNGLFDMALGEKPGVAKKPAPDAVNLVLNTLQIDRADAVYIGDSDVDVATAVNSEMDMIIVTWGFRDEDFLREKGATRIVSTTDEVFRMIVS